MIRVQTGQRSTKRDNPTTVSSPLFSPATNNNLLSGYMTPENLIVTQQNDASLLKLCNEAIPQKEIDKPPALNYKDDILTRFNRPTDLSVEDTWSEKHQLVLLVSIRTPILKSLMEVVVDVLMSLRLTKRFFKIILGL